MSALLTYLQNGSASSGDYNSLNFVLPSLFTSQVCEHLHLGWGGFSHLRIHALRTGQILIILSNRDSNGIKAKLEGGLQRLHSADDVATK